MDRLLRPLFVVLWSTGFIAGTLGTRDTPPLALTVTAVIVLPVGLLTGTVKTSVSPGSAYPSPSPPGAASVNEKLFVTETFGKSNASVTSAPIPGF